ncbi:uncharacterized protein LOC144602683 [Rhinoraja longicauda]
MQWGVVAWYFLLLSGAVGSDESIRQSPSQVTVTEGGTVRLNCTVVGKRGNGLGAISWYVDTETRTVHNTSGDYYGRVLKFSSTGILSESIEITDLKMNDTGRYHCQATFLLGGIFHGSGTAVTVTRMSTAVTVTVTRSILEEGRAWRLRSQLLVMAAKLATFVVINVIIVFIICYWESCRFASRGKEAEQAGQTVR